MELSGEAAQTLQKVSDSFRIMGRIRRTIPEKGFGFIAGDDGIDYFFHWSAFKKSSSKEFAQLAVRDRVEFNPIVPPDKKPRAIELVYIDD